MANYPTLKYTQLQDRFRALTGLETLQVTDQAFLRDLVNRRIRIAFERYPWPVFTLVGEPVTLSSNQFTTYNVGGAGTSLANNANVVFRIHKEDPITTRYPDEHTFLQDTDNITGNPIIKIISPESLSGQSIYVTYRKDLRDVINVGGATTGYFGDEDGDNQEVPYLFFEYASHGALADFLRGDGQNSKAQAEESYAESLLIHEIDKVSNQGRQFRHDILQYRPPSQFNRHNVAVGGAPIGGEQAQLRNNVQ